MIERELKDITEETLRGLTETGATEGKTLEFKRALDIDGTTPRLKFLRGIASFANASGGDMVFGIATDDESKAKNLVPLDGFNPDKDTLRIRDIIRMSIEPRGLFLEMEPVEIAGGYALVIRIRKSWAGAHFVNGDMRFYTRDQNGMRPMDIPEIRNAFTLAEGLTEQINRFRLERIGNIVAGEVPHPLMDSGKVVLHLCPLSSFGGGRRCDVNAPQRARVPFIPLNANGANSRYDVDGRYVYQPWTSEEIATGYTLVSHAGWIEAVDSEWLHKGGGITPPIIPTYSLERELLQALPSYFKILKLIGAEAPVCVMLSFLGVRGFTVYGNPRYSNRTLGVINRDNILIPGTIVDTLDLERLDRSQPTATDILRPMFDVIWNACGLAKSRHFDGNGNWRDEPD